MSTTFPTPLNDLLLTLRSARVVNASSLALAAGDGAKILAALAELSAPSVSPTHPLRAVVSKASYAGRGDAAIFNATGLAGDDLTGVTVAEGYADQAFPVGSTVEFDGTAGAAKAVQDAVNMLETGLDSLTIAVAACALDSAVVHLSGNYANPSWITSLSADKLTSGTLPAARMPATAVTAGSYTSANITIGADGRITAASNGSGGGGGPSIGGAVTSGTAKSVLYVDASGLLAQDNANFAWDASNHRLGILVNTPATALHVGAGGVVRIQSSSTAYGEIYHDGFGLVVNSSSNSAVTFGGNFATTSDPALKPVNNNSASLGVPDKTYTYVCTRQIRTDDPSGTNAAGNNLLIRPQAGTGNAAGGSVKVQVAAAGASGSSVNTFADALTIASDKSATFAGIASGPTASAGTNTTQFATTQFVQAAIAALVNSAPSILDTLGEIATQLQSDESVASALATTVGGKLTASNNLSDLPNAGTARTNLGLGSIATHAATEYFRAVAPTALKTANYSASVGDFIPVDATSGSVTITLPTAPADRSVVEVKLIATSGTNTCSIARGGSTDVFNKAGGSTSLTLSATNQSAFVQYDAADAIWYVISADNSSGGYAAGSGITITTSGGVRTIAATGGGGSPGGSTGQVQYNSSGAFAGAGNLSIDGGRLSTAGTAPTGSFGTGAGTSPSGLTVTGNDQAGRVDFTTGTSPTGGGDIVTLTFASAFGSAPKTVILTPANSVSGTHFARLYAGSMGTSGWTLKNGSSAMAASTAYSYYYLVIG